MNSCHLQVGSVILLEGRLGVKPHLRQMPHHSRDHESSSDAMALE